MKNKTRRQKKKRRTGLNGIWCDEQMANVVGLLVRKLRINRRLTQEQLAAQCQVRGLNLTRSALAKIEARVRFVKACELFIIARVLDRPMEEFYPTNYGLRPR